MSAMRFAAAIVAIGLSLGACDASAPEAAAPRAVPQGAGFDFYVLALSWSPSYCEIEGANANRQQCSGPVDHHFVVHGLWPQFERGWPEFCASREPDRVPDALVRDYLDIMPSAGLIGHQWRKHGSCSGLGQADYLTVVRAAWDRITVPARYEAPAADIRVSPAEVEADFLAANRGLSKAGIAVGCDRGHISEVRICLGKDLSFRACPEIDERGCRASSSLMPAAD